jgi:hypothetical protein
MMCCCEFKRAGFWEKRWNTWNTGTNPYGAALSAASDLEPSWNTSWNRSGLIREKESLNPVPVLERSGTPLEQEKARRSKLFRGFVPVFQCFCVLNLLLKKTFIK